MTSPHDQAPQQPGVLALTDPKALEAQAGLAWIKQAWAIFTRSWQVFLLAVLLMFALRFILTAVPFIGILMAALVTPLLAAGFQQMAYNVEHQGSITIADLFVAFQQQNRHRLQVLLQLGCLSLAFSLVLMLLLSSVLLPGQQVDQSASLQDVMLQMQTVLSNLQPAVLLWLAGFAILGVLYSCAVYFAVPLLWFSDYKLLDALQFSLRGCRLNVLPLLVFALLMAVIFVVAFIPYGLGLIVVVPLMMLATYTGFRQIYTTDESRPQESETS